MLQSHHHLLSSFHIPLFPPSSPSHFHTYPSFHFLHRPFSLHTLSSHQFPTRPGKCLAQFTESPIPDDGPIQLPQSDSIFASTDDPSTLQVATSVLLTGAISVFLFRSVLRRARRAKQLKFRSSGAKKSLTEDAMESLKAMTPASVDGAKSPPSAVQALLGGISAVVIALILYKFTTTIEASLNRQTLSDSFSVRQITITIRTIINGLCYLATFVFGINGVGLVLYSGQLAINSFMEDSTSKETDKIDEASSSNVTSSDSSENGRSGDQNSDSWQ